MAHVKYRVQHVDAPYSLSIERPIFPPSYEEEGNHGFTVNERVYFGDSPFDWKTRILTGQDASSEMIGERLYFDQTPAKFSATGLKSTALGEVWSYNGYMPTSVSGLIYPDVVPLEKAANQAATSVLSSYKQAVASFRGLDFAAEFLETVSLFTNPIKSLFGHSVGLARRIGKVKGIAFTYPRKYAAEISSAYLAFQFAIAPLADDLANAAVEVQTILENSAKVRGISGHGEDEVQLVAPEVHDAFGCGGMASYERYVSKRSQVRYKGKIALNLNSIGDRMSGLGFSPPDIIPAIWEAVPFSFLVDYFTNVGDVLYRSSTASASPYLRYVTLGVRNTLKVEHSGIRENPLSSDISGGFYKVNSASGGASSYHLVTLHRSSGAELPPVTLQFHLPAVKQVFNIAALITAINASKPIKQF